MKFIVGIGNPGKKYDSTRHNVGFAAVEALARKAAFGKTWKADKHLKAQVLDLDGALLLKPETFVNLTGETVQVLVKKHSATPADLLFLCDDVNLAFGKLRLRPTGSAGGHHGLESVMGALDSEDFARLRIGVGNEGMPKDDLTDFVLGRFEAAEKKALPALLDKAATVCESWMNDGFDGARTCLSRLQSTP